MQAMNDMSDSGDKDRLSWRNSVLVWVSGAVLGWVVAVVAVYSVIRTEEDALIARPPSDPKPQSEFADDPDADRLNEVMPAAGDSTTGDSLQP